MEREDHFTPLEAKRHRRNFMIAQFAMGMFVASTLYASAYLKELGLTPGQVGLFTSIRSVVGVIVPIAWGMACDKYRTVKRVFLICLGGVILLFPTVPLFYRIPIGMIPMAAFMTVVVRFFYRPLDYMFSGWMVQMERRVPGLEYGKVRLFSSAASAIASMVFTYLIAQFSSVRVGYFGGGLLAVLVLFTIFPLPDVACEEKQLSLKNLRIGRLMRDPILLAFLIVMVFANIPSSSTSIYIPYLLDDIGANISILGAFNTVRSFCGIPMMYLSGRLVRRFGARRVLTVSIIILGCGELAFSLARSVQIVLGIGLVLGFNSGLTMVSQVLYAQELAPPELRSTVQMLNSTTLALATIIASAIGGSVVSPFGVRTYYRITFAIVMSSTAAFIAFSAYIAKKRQRQQSEALSA